MRFVLHSFDPPEEFVADQRRPNRFLAAASSSAPSGCCIRLVLVRSVPFSAPMSPTRDRLVAVKVFRLDIMPEQAQVARGRADAAPPRPGSSIPPSSSPSRPASKARVAYRAEEYVAAESLDVAMRHYAPASIDKALPFITQLAGAIDFARAAGVGHGGLHPRDIFVTPDEARATGFGVVEALERVGIRAPVRRPYSPPERIDGSRGATPADVFSLAAITFELLTGRRPAGTGAEIGALAAGSCRTAAPALHAVLARAMDDDPARRYPTALAFAAALEAAAHGEAARRPPRPPRRVHRFRLRSRAGAASRLGSCTGRPMPPPAVPTR